VPTSQGAPGVISRFRRWAFVAAASSLALSVLGVSATAAAAPKLQASDVGVTSSTITIGFISDFTGIASASFVDSVDGANARLALQNAEGGVDGRKLKLISVDAQSSFTYAPTAAHELLAKNPFGVIDFTEFLVSGGYKVLSGVPVTGGAWDGPEWGTQPNTNMFSYTGGLDPKYPATTIDGSFLKSIGATSVAGLGYADPSAVASVKDLVFSDSAAGLKNCYENTTVPIADTEMGPDVLSIKGAQCNAVVGSFTDPTDVALSTGLQQAGLKVKQLYFTGYDQTTLDQPSAKAADQGDYFLSSTEPFTKAYPAAESMLKALKKYDPHYQGGIPDFGLIGGWLSADLMIRGLEAAGQNPTRESFITNLQKVTNYDAEGLLPNTVSFAHFGHLPAKSCNYFVQLKGNAFVVANGGKPMCGTVIPHSDAD
jgi:branched-chain amino acid transport system substrate-binding protein